ncbi:hypothetical protein AGMMS50276_31190 [Synergistales bacterium]|nr:hypothetical protein AGMMS50276_31190 [Synergistales bacterium]
MKKLMLSVFVLVLLVGCAFGNDERGKTTMATTKWVSVCKECGKSLGSSVSMPEGQRPYTTPGNNSSKCPSSPDGKHKPVWEKQ